MLLLLLLMHTHRVNSGCEQVPAGEGGASGSSLYRQQQSHQFSGKLWTCWCCIHCGGGGGGGGGVLQSFGFLECILSVVAVGKS